MTNDQIADFLQRIRPTPHPFTVIQTGKKSKKVNGLYKQDSAEILLHNRNFTSPQDMLRTAIHEYAHHLHFNSETPPHPRRPHDRRFWALFHDLLAEAEKKKIFVDVFRTDAEFKDLTKIIREKYLKPHAAFLRELGESLQRAENLCRDRSLSFRDYLERELGLKLPTARLAMALNRERLPDEITPDQARTVLNLPHEERPRAIEELQSGATESQVLGRSGRSESTDPAAPSRLQVLQQRKNRLESLIKKYQNDLQKLEAEIEIVKKGDL